MNSQDCMPARLLPCSTATRQHDFKGLGQSRLLLCVVGLVGLVKCQSAFAAGGVFAG
jgi:hypothetical protein